MSNRDCKTQHCHCHHPKDRDVMCTSDMTTCIHCMPMNNNKPQQDTWKERLKRRFDIPTWMRQRQGIDDNDTFTAEEVQETLECFYDDFIQLSEQQGYQRGLQEALEMIGEDENSFISHGALGVHDCEPEKMKSRNQLRAELRKKLSETMK